jgi:hypothetical protein
MSADTTIHLPAQVNVRDVAKVIAVLFGEKKKWYCYESRTEHEAPQKTGWVEVDVTIKPTNVPAMVQIDLSASLLKKANSVLGDGWWFTYHFESEGGMRYMSGGSRAARIALHRRLANFFGGKVNYNDCDSKYYRRRSPDWLGKERSDVAFHKKELAIWNLKPITEKEVADCVKFSAYGK